MLNTVTTPIGIDAHVYWLQTDLFALVDTWGITSADYESYALCQRNYIVNQDREGYIPEILVTGAKDYHELLLNDKVAVQSFFGFNDVAGTHDGVSHLTANIHLIFFVNLSLIKNNAIRADVDARRDVFKILKRAQYGFELQSEIIGVDSVLSEYSGVSRKDMAIRADMRPYHCFRYNLTCQYNPKAVVNFNT